MSSFYCIRVASNSSTVAYHLDRYFHTWQLRSGNQLLGRRNGISKKKTKEDKQKRKRWVILFEIKWSTQKKKNHKGGGMERDSICIAPDYASKQTNFICDLYFWTKLHAFSSVCIKHQIFNLNMNTDMTTKHCWYNLAMFPSSIKLYKGNINYMFDSKPPTLSHIYIF